jgi:hypothetical protein
LKFDLSPIPENAVIESATLTVMSFYMEEFDSSGLTATRITSDWDVYTVESFFPEFEQIPFPQIMADPEMGMNEYDVIEMVAGVVRHGEQNHGIMLYLPTGAPDGEYYDLYVISCDNYDPWGRPKLTITYTVGGTPQ